MTSYWWRPNCVYILKQTDPSEKYKHAQTRTDPHTYANAQTHTHCGAVCSRVDLVPRATDDEIGFELGAFIRSDDYVLLGHV